MSKFEGTPNMDSPEIGPAEVQADANVGKKLEGEAAPEQLKEQPEPSTEEQLESLEGEMEARQQEMERLTKSIEETKVQLNEVREKLGLPPTEEDPPSISAEKDKLEKLEAQQAALERQKDQLISQQERERLIREEKEKILQERLDELFKEFQALNARDLESILRNGKTSEGRKVESKSMGALSPELAQSLAKAFKEGARLLPKILEVLPGLLKKFDEDLTKEATKRVEKKLEEEKQKMQEEQKKEGTPEELKPKATQGETPSSEIKPEVSSGDGGSVGTEKE